MAKTEAVPQKDKYDFSKLNTLAVVSLAAALTGIGAVAAIITGHISLAQIKRTGENGRALAIAGLVVAYAVIAFWLLSTAFWVGIGMTHWNGFDGVNPMVGNNWGPGMMNNYRN